MKKWIIFASIAVIIIAAFVYLLNFYPNVNREGNNLDILYSATGKVVAQEGQSRFHLGFGRQIVFSGADKSYQACLNINPFYSNVNIPDKESIKEAKEDLMESLGPTVLTPYETPTGFRYLGGRDSDMLLDYNFSAKTTELITTFEIIGSTELLWAPNKKHVLLNGIDQNGDEGYWLTNLDNKSTKKIDVIGPKFLNDTEIVGIQDGKLVKQGLSSQTNTIIYQTNPVGFTADNNRVGYWTSKKLYTIVNEEVKEYNIKNINKLVFGRDYLLLNDDKGVQLIKLGESGASSFAIRAITIGTYKEKFIIDGTDGAWLLNPQNLTAQKFSNASPFDLLFENNSKILGIENDTLHTFVLN